MGGASGAGHRGEFFLRQGVPCVAASASLGARSLLGGWPDLPTRGAGGCRLVGDRAPGPRARLQGGGGGGGVGVPAPTGATGARRHAAGLPRQFGCGAYFKLLVPRCWVCYQGPLLQILPLAVPFLCWQAATLGPGQQPGCALAELSASEDAMPLQPQIGACPPQTSGHIYMHLLMTGSCLAKGAQGHLSLMLLNLHSCLMCLSSGCSCGSNRGPAAASRRPGVGAGAGVWRRRRGRAGRQAPAPRGLLRPCLCCRCPPGRQRRALGLCGQLRRGGQQGRA